MMETERKKMKWETLRLSAPHPSGRYWYWCTGWRDTKLSQREREMDRRREGGSPIPTRATWALLSSDQSAQCMDWQPRQCRPQSKTKNTHERIKVEEGFLPHEIHHAYATGSSLGLRQTYCGNSVESKGAGLMIRDEKRSCSLNLQAANHRINNQRESEERGREESAALNANPCLIKISSI